MGQNNSYERVKDSWGDLAEVWGTDKVHLDCHEKFGGRGEIRIAGVAMGPKKARKLAELLLKYAAQVEQYRRSRKKVAGK